MEIEITNRYTDKDLAEFKVLIGDKMAMAKSHLELLKSSYIRNHE
jgi:DnaK suppressor protein